MGLQSGSPQATSRALIITWSARALNAPREKSVDVAVQSLIALGALFSDDESVTPLGAALAKARKAAGAAADPLPAFRDDALRRLEGAAPPFDAAALARVRAALDAAIT